MLIIYSHGMVYIQFKQKTIYIILSIVMLSADELTKKTKLF